MRKNVLSLYRYSHRSSMAGQVALLFLFAAPLLRGNEVQTGQELYKQHCLVCHGAQGEGTAEHYSKTLAGDRSVAQLAKFIAKSMPPEAPGTCVGEEADRVAAYIHSAFYSPEAQLRLRPPRIETARLTGRQYANAVADLTVAFFGTQTGGERTGLEASYSTVDAKGEGKHVMTRVDPEIKFDFGTSSPDKQKFDPAEFSISWTGSIRAPATGEYEFIVRSPNSFKLLINDKEEKRPIIDAWIKSGNQTEYRGAIRLLAGRFYRLRLNFTKAGQGVKKPDQLRAQIAPASIALTWKPPGRGEEPIPSRYLSPQETRETLVIQTAFPPDDRSTGFERGTAVSAEWEQATTDAAIEAIAHVRERIGDLSGIGEPEKQHEAKLREFCVRFAERAFRRPLTPEQRALYVDRQFEKAPDVTAAIDRVVLMVLKSPRFLYVDVSGANLDDYARASRLSFALWDSIPDDALLAAAAAGQLNTPEQIASHARRMTIDPRFDAKLREFFLQWLKVDQSNELRKDANLFPEFNPLVASDLRASLELFLDDVLRQERPDFRKLLLSNELYLNPRLAPLYGIKMDADAGFQQAAMNPAERAGVLSHPYLMATFADASNSSPIRRGVFVARSLLGRTLKPPPDAVTPIPPELHPEWTTRERTTVQTSAKACQSCHGLINPLGFPLENFDALGRIRTKESEQAIDATGSYLSRTGELVPFSGVRSLAEYLAGSDEVHTAFIEKLFYYSVKQPVRAFGPEVLPKLKQEFISNEYNIRRLMSDIATAAALSKAGEQ